MDDDALPPLADVVLALVLVDGEDAVTSALDAPEGTTVERVAIAFPLELEMSTEGGHVTAVGASPPTQYTLTTVMPVFHQLQLTLGIHDEHPA